MPQPLSRRRSIRRSRRSGFSILEVLIVLVILAIVGSSVISILNRQQRFYRDAGETLTVRRELRGAASLLPTEVRSISLPDVDIQTASATELHFRATIGSAIICDKGAGPVLTFDIPPTNLANHVLTAWYSKPEPGDQAWIFDDFTDAGAQDDAWRPYTIISVAPNTTACHGAGHPYTHPTLDAPGTKPRWRITVSTGLEPTIVRGAAVRFTREVRYQLYQPAGSDNFYLGYQQMVNGSWTAMQPVAGPFNESGVEFSYFTAGGIATNTPAQIARVDVRLDASGQRAVLAERNGIPMRDSLSLRIGVRNLY